MPGQVLEFLSAPVGLIIAAAATYAFARHCRDYFHTKARAITSIALAVFFTAGTGSVVVRNERAIASCEVAPQTIALTGILLIFAVIAIIGYRRSGYVRPMSIDEALGAFWSERLPSREKMRRALAVLEKGPIKPEFLEMARAVAVMPPGWASAAPPAED
jgi:hypothetical protein